MMFCEDEGGDNQASTFCFSSIYAKVVISPYTV